MPSNKYIQVPGIISDEGAVIAENATLLKKWIEKNKGRSIRISLEHFGNKRSTQQNRYYWGVVIMMIKDRFKFLGHDLTEEEVHDFLKKEYNYKEIRTENDYFFKIPQSTTTQDTQSFFEYIERIRRFASLTLDLDIPDPDINYLTTISFN